MLRSRPLRLPASRVTDVLPPPPANLKAATESWAVSGLLERISRPDFPPGFPARISRPANSRAANRPVPRRRRRRRCCYCSPAPRSPLVRPRVKYTKMMYAEMTGARTCARTHSLTHARTDSLKHARTQARKHARARARTHTHPSGAVRAHTTHTQHTDTNTPNIHSQAHTNACLLSQ